MRIAAYDTGLPDARTSFRWTISGSVIQALRYLGKDHVTEETVQRLDRRLSPDDRKQL